MFSFITRSSASLAVRASRPQFKRSITLLSTCRATSLLPKAPSNILLSNQSQRSFHISSILRREVVCFNVQDDQDFEERVLEAEVPVVADFHAEWCGPCKLLGPRIESEVDKQEGKVMLAKVDVDDFPELAMKYKVNVVPSVIKFKNGKEIDRFQGNIDDDLLTHFITKGI